MKRRYNIFLTPEDDGIGYVVTSPDIRGLVTYGETREEALAMALDAAEALLLCTMADGEELPLHPGPSEATTIEVDLDSLKTRLAAEKAAAIA
jgi:predicted RNase H-like HicB family nuclease